MEAATPLRKPTVRTVGNAVAIDGVVVEDETAVRLVHEREEAGEDAIKAVVDAIEIGARVLDREQAGANAEAVKAEMEKATRELNAEFSQRAENVSEALERQIAEVFGPESGHVTKALERHFGDGSSEAVQHRVKAALNEALGQVRGDMLKLFTSADASNPLSEFKASALRAIADASRRQESALTRMDERVAGLHVELERLRGEADKAEEVAEERERGTAKGRTYEEDVFTAIEAIATGQNDEAEPVGDQPGSDGRKGDVVVDIDACLGPARGRIVFEAKDSRLDKPRALRELDGALRARDADFAILVVPSEDELPPRGQELREMNGDKMFVVYDPEGPSPAGLRLAYLLARSRILMSRGAADGLDLAAMEEALERAVASLNEARKVKSQLTSAKNTIDGAYTGLEALEAGVRAQLEQVQRLLAEAAVTVEDDAG
jgi:hypothetical protein